MFNVLHLLNGKECTVFDCPQSMNRDINVDDFINVEGIIYKVFSVKYTFSIRGGNELQPIERMVMARNKEEFVEYQSVYGNINRMERAIDFFKKVHPLLNTGHSLESAYEKLYNE